MSDDSAWNACRTTYMFSSLTLELENTIDISMQSPSSRRSDLNNTSAAERLSLLHRLRRQFDSEIFDHSVAGPNRHSPGGLPRLVGQLPPRSGAYE